jgi:uncharacterized protein HemX
MNSQVLGLPMSQISQQLPVIPSETILSGSSFLTKYLTKRNIIILIVAVIALGGIVYFTKRKNKQEYPMQHQMQPQMHPQMMQHQMHPQMQQQMQQQMPQQMMHQMAQEDDQEEQFDPQQISQQDLESLQNQIGGQPIMDPKA